MREVTVRTEEGPAVKWTRNGARRDAPVAGPPCCSNGGQSPYSKNDDWGLPKSEAEECQTEICVDRCAELERFSN